MLSEVKFRTLLARQEPRSGICASTSITRRARTCETRSTTWPSAPWSAVRSGHLILVLSDAGAQRGKLPVHALLATGAVHHRLIDEGLRCDANIVVETATARDPHHFAVLIGYGATAVYPYLAYEVVHDQIRRGEIQSVDVNQAGVNYRRGINKGLYKIISKMGISTIQSYRGAQLFEIVGLHSSVVDLCFKGTTSRIQGMHFADLDQDRRRLAWDAWNPTQDSRIRAGCSSTCMAASTTRSIRMWSAPCRRRSNSGDYAKYREYAASSTNARWRRCATCYAARRRDAAFPSTRWNRRAHSTNASTPPACLWARCRPRPTKPSRWP